MHMLPGDISSASWRAIWSLAVLVGFSKIPLCAAEAFEAIYCSGRLHCIIVLGVLEGQERSDGVNISFVRQ